MDGIIGFIAGMGIVELIVLFVVGMILCYLLVPAPSFMGIVVLVLSIVVGIKVLSVTDNIFLAILAAVIAGGIFIFPGSLLHEKLKAKSLGFSSSKEMTEFEIELRKQQRLAANESQQAKEADGAKNHE